MAKIIVTFMVVLLIALSLVAAIAARISKNRTEKDVNRIEKTIAQRRMDIATAVLRREQSKSHNTGYDGANVVLVPSSVHF